jgi:hypothetical protein
MSWLGWVGLGMFAILAIGLLLGALVAMWRGGDRAEAMLVAWVLAAFVFVAIGGSAK